MIKTLLGQIREYKKISLIAPLLTAMEVFLELLIPYVTASIIDKGINAGNLSQIYFYGGVMLILAFFSLLTGALSGRFSAIASAGFASNLRDSMYENIQTFAFSNIDKYSTAGLVTRMTTDVTNVQNAFQMTLRIAVRAPLTLLFSLIMCFTINVRLSLIFLFAGCVLAAVLAIVIRTTYPVFTKVFRQYDDVNAAVQENTSAIRVVKTFVREDHEKSKFRTATEQLYRLFSKAEGRTAINNPIMLLMVYGCMIVLSWFGAQYIVAGNMTTGNLTSMFTYIMSIMMSLMLFSMFFVMMTLSVASAQRIAEVLQEVPDLKNPQNAETIVKDGSIRFSHVSFSYKHGSGEETLHNIDFSVSSGETIGIIGGTGSGKSSLVNLICRLYDVSSGTIYIGNKDVRNYDLETLRNEVAVVLQKNVLFSGTILENLRWGKEDASESECEDACRLACADEFIKRFPDRYNTWVEQGGTNLSGGQKQRLCIARALLKKPKILILDDSTSAVDTATDAAIREAFSKHIPNTTKIIIAQRISSIQNADHILVLDDGKINGYDTHEHLLENNTIYQEIYETQMKGGGDFDEPASMEMEVTA